MNLKCLVYRVILLNLFALFSFVSLAQDSANADSLAERGMVHKKNGEYDQSLVVRQEAMNLFGEIGDHQKSLEQYAFIIELLIIKGEYTKADVFARDGKKRSSSKGFPNYEDIFNEKLGWIHMYLSRPYEAVNFFEQSLEYRAVVYGKSSIQYADVLNGMARVKMMLGENKEAKEYLDQGFKIVESNPDANEKTKILLLHTLRIFYQNVSLLKKLQTVDEEALELSLMLYGENHPTTAQSYYNLASCFVWLREPAKSELYNFKSIQIRESLFGRDYAPLAANYNILASNYYNQDMYSKSLESANEGYRIAYFNFGKKHLKTLWAMTYQVKVFNATGRAKEGLEIAKEVLEIKKQMFKEEHREVASGYRSLAGSYNFLGDYVQAKQNFLKSIEIDKKINEPSASNALPYMMLAQFNTRLGLFHEGIENANDSFIENNPLVSSIEDLEWPQVQGYETFREYYWAGAFKIYCLYSLADQNADSAVVYYKAALQGAHFLDSLVLNELKKVTHSDKKFLSSANSHRAMELGFWSAQFLFEKTKESIYQEEMLYFNERSKANMLLIKSQSRNASSFAGVPNEIIENQKHLSKSIELKRSEYLESISNQFADNQHIHDIRNAIYEEEAKLQEVNTIIKNEYPRYHAIIHETQPVNLASVQQFLSYRDKKSAIVEYLVTTGNVYYTLILPDTVKNFNVRYDQRVSMHSKVMDFRKSILDREDSLLQGYSGHLYELLIDSIQPILNSKKIQSLIVIPDGALSYLPFEILSANNKDYLMENFDISYAHSITLLMQEKQIIGRSNMISFAPEFSQSLVASNDIVRGELSKLPGAFDEVNALSEILDNKPFLKQAASETNFKKNAYNYGIIHLATHAIVDESSPESAKLVFNIENDTINDGNLYSHEIYNLDLKAQLVTLSACNTGFGQIKKGEGVMSLSRAFAYAGVPSTVVSLWPASDKSTPELMKYFYQNLKDGQRKSEALNNARKQYLSTAKGKARHPFYWGGFVVIGDDSPITNNENSSVSLILSLLFLLTAVPIVLVIKNKYLSID